MVAAAAGEAALVVATWAIRDDPLNHMPELALHGDLQIGDEPSGRPHHLNG
jgi:hypothetical protein